MKGGGMQKGRGVIFREHKTDQVEIAIVIST